MTMPPVPTFRLFLATLLLLGGSQAHAERADRNQPMMLEANKVTMDDVRGIKILEGDVLLSQGTLNIRASKIVVTEDAYGFQKGVAFGDGKARAHFRQKREGRDEYIEGEADRIEYDTRTEIAELFQHAWVRSGDDQLKGDYIWYDSIAEKYLVTAGENRDPKAAPPRVRAVIQPRSKSDAPPTEGAPSGLQLKRSIIPATAP
jgi:lipopolysaccharide export system protein LptA